MVDPFRKRALDRLSSPEDLDRLVRISSPATWFALGGLLLVIAGVVLWATFTSITTTVSGLGYVLPEGGLDEASAARAGTVHAIDVIPGQVVRPGERVASIRLTEGGELSVTAPEAGRVAEILRKAGDFVPQGGEVVILVPVRRLVVETFLPTADAKEAHIGDLVWVEPTSAAASQFGFARGRVVRIGSIPMPEAGIDSLLENTARVNAVNELGPVIHLVVELLRGNTASGLSWTASRGPSEPITLGSRAAVQVVTGDRKPIDYVLG
jgi:HlyD family secretion protein